MKHNLWFKNSANSNYQNNCKSVLEKHKSSTMPASVTKKKTKRVRSAFTTDQINYLEREYKNYPYIGTGHRKEIATTLNIAERTVKIWFQNRRMKEKKDTISKEFCGDQTGREMEFTKSRLNNVIAVQSANDQSLNSLPSMTCRFDSPVESTINNKAFNIQNLKASAERPSKYLQKPSLPKKSDPKLLSLFKSRGLQKPPRISPQPPIGSCKKILKLDNNLRSICNNPIAKTHGSSLPLNISPIPKITPEDLSTKKSLQSEQKPCTGFTQGMPGYVPVVPNYYPQPFVSPSGVLWKPVNIMSVMPRCPISSSFNLNTQQQTSASKMCNCNCHSKSFPINVGLPNPPSPQYVLTALPLQNPSTKF